MVEDKCIVDIYWSLDYKYYAFLIENRPCDGLQRMLHIHHLQRYKVSGLDMFEKLFDLCDELKYKSREYAKSEIEKLVQE